MSDDHLDKEVSLSAELTPTGVKAGAKSRFISAVDRLLGGVVDAVNVPLENIAKRGRAKGNADVQLIEALGQKRLEHLHENPAFAHQALEHHLRTTVKRHENKAAVVTLAIEDLRTDPPSEDQNAAGAEALDDGFLNRFERYAEDATTEQLRERWGRVLASEIRSPGTFSAKVMRVVDELDSITAASFERVCQHRIGNTLISCLVGDLEFMELKRLVTADLVIEPGSLGQIKKSIDTTDSRGVKLKIFGFETWAIAVEAGIKEPPQIFEASGKSIISDEQGPAIPVYVLTDVGHAICSILPHDEAAVVRNLASRIALEMAPAKVYEYLARNDGQMSVMNTWNNDGTTVS